MISSQYPGVGKISVTGTSFLQLYPVSSSSSLAPAYWLSSFCSNLPAGISIVFWL